MPVSFEALTCFSLQLLQSKVLPMNQTNKNTTSQYTCSDYREEMVILALRQKLMKTTLTGKERKELEKQISQLEEKIGF